MLIEHAWDRKFGEQLPTLEDVMAEAESMKLQPKGGGKTVVFKDKDNYEKAKKSGDYEDPEGPGDGGEKEEPTGKLGGGDFDRDSEGEKDEPEGGEKSRMSSTDMDDVDDSLRSLKQQPKDDIKPPPELERGIANVIAKIESGTTTDDDLEWAKDAHKQLNIQSGYNQYLSDMESDLKDALKKADEPEGTDNSAALKKIKRKDLNKLSGGDAWEKDFYSDDDIFLGSPDYEQEEGDAYWESPDLDGLSRATDHTTLKQKFFDLHAYRSTLQSRIEMADDEGDTEEVAKLQKDWMKAAKQQNNIVGMMKPQKPQFKGMSGRSSYGGVGIRDSVTINGKKYKEVKEEKKVTEKHILREMYEKIGGK